MSHQGERQTWRQGHASNIKQQVEVTVTRRAANGGTRTSEDQSSDKRSQVARKCGQDISTSSTQGYEDIPYGLRLHCEGEPQGFGT